MSAVRSISLTLYGQQIDPLDIVVGQSISWNLTLLNPNDPSEAFDLTNDTVTMSLVELDGGAPVDPPILSSTGVLTSTPTDGLCTVSWAPTDTVISGTALASGVYGLDAWVSTTGSERCNIMQLSYINIRAAGTLP